jgi:hypothetical protein
MMDRPLTAREIPFASHKQEQPRVFTAAADGRYVLEAPSIGIVLEADRLRWERHELRGELVVRCELAGAPVTDGILTSGTFNLSYTNARRDQARWIADRARVPLPEVTAALEELCHRVLHAERVGRPATLLHTIARPTADDAIDIDGIVLPRRHPAILFGDGGCGKSYIALLILGMLARQGHQVLFVDWELDGRDHRDRLERLFGADMPHVHYARCDRPISAEADRLRRLVAQHQIAYAAFDSVAFAAQ